MHSAEVLVRKYEKMKKATSGRPRFGDKSGQAEVVILVQKMLGFMQMGKTRSKEHWRWTRKLKKK